MKVGKMMEIIVGRTAGFCYGVKRAVKSAENEINNSEEQVCCLGEIVHNKQVVNELKEKGIKFVENIDEANNKTIIRAHGIPKEVYEKAGGFEEELSVAFNDVDFCLRVRNIGYLIVYDPLVEAYHYESKSRGAEDSPEKVARFQAEIEFMRNRWEDLLKKGDHTK